MSREKDIEIYNEVLGLLDAACAKLQPIIADDDKSELERKQLKGIWHAIGYERAEVARMSEAEQ